LCRPTSASLPSWRSPTKKTALVLESGARVIGVNNCDMRDVTVDLGTDERLAPVSEMRRSWPRAA
jgi:indole-3-glycerol phosphate synthase